MEKSAALAPPMAPALVMLMAAARRLPRVIVFAGLVVPSGSVAKVVVAGKSAAAMPVPFSVAVCMPTLSVTLKVAVSGPTSEDVKVTV